MSTASSPATEAKYHGTAKHDRDSIAIVVSRWNAEITEKLAEAAIATLQAHGVKAKNIKKHYVPGSYELPLAASHLASLKAFDAVICLGCIIKGETPHNAYISQAIAASLITVALKNHLPVIFGVLTPNDMQQAVDRAGGKYGNKGEEAAIAALEMIDLLSTQPDEIAFLG